MLDTELIFILCPFSLGDRLKHKGLIEETGKLFDKGYGYKAFTTATGFPGARLTNAV